LVLWVLVWIFLDSLCHWWCLIGSPGDWFRIWDPEELFWALIDVLWNWTLVTWFFGLGLGTGRAQT
jgi:hypothetical protein